MTVQSENERNNAVADEYFKARVRMTTPVGIASRVTNGSNAHRSLTTHLKPQGSSKFVVVIASAGSAANPTTISLTSTHR